MALIWSSLGHVHIPELCLDWPGWSHVLPCSWGHDQGAGNNGISTSPQEPHSHSRENYRPLPEKGETGTGQAEATVFPLEQE